MEAKYLTDISLDTKQKIGFVGTQFCLLHWRLNVGRDHFQLIILTHCPRTLYNFGAVLSFLVLIWALSCVILNSCSNSSPTLNWIHQCTGLFTNKRTITQALRLQDQSLCDFSEEAPHG